jgi:hypothetical protein
MRYWRRLMIVALFSLPFVSCYLALRQDVYVSIVTCFDARFETMPPGDEALEQWLRAQPGVVKHTIWINRLGEDKKTLEVSFIRSQNMAGHPPIPDLDTKCAELGYTKPDSPFRPCPETERFRSK